MTNPTGLKIKLKYLRLDVDDEYNDHLPAQPVEVLLRGNKTMTKLVPVPPLLEYDRCIGCIAEDNHGLRSPRIDCFELPNCDNTMYVRANPTNLLRHIAWRLENDK